MSSPLKRRVTAALSARATTRLDDPAATSLDYACEWISAGRTIADLAADLAAELGVSVSRPFLSGILHSSPEATTRLEAARRDGAGAIMDDAVRIAYDAEPTPGAVAKARLQVGTREWLAERFAPGVFGGKSTATVSVNLGQLMLEALRMPAPPRPAELTPALGPGGDAIGDETAHD